MNNFNFKFIKQLFQINYLNKEIKSQLEQVVEKTQLLSLMY
jgi:hypothetical protein